MLFTKKETLVDNFRKELIEAYREGKKINYKATEMLDALTEKDDELFKGIIINFVATKNAPSGFIKLWKNQRLDLSIEYIISIKDKGKYSSLFPKPLIDICKNRLDEYGFKKIISTEGE